MEKVRRKRSKGKVRKSQVSAPAGQRPAATGERAAAKVRTSPAASCSLREPGQQVVQAGGKKRSRSEVLKAYWRDVKAGARERVERSTEAPRGAEFNVLLGLPEEERSKLYVWIRECPYRDAFRAMLKEKGIRNVTNDEIEEFFQEETEFQTEMRMSRAATEANALVAVAEKHAANYPGAILAALGQQAFQHLSKEQPDHSVVSTLVTLFLKARSDDRSDQIHELRREHLRQDLQDELDRALEKLTEEVQRHPEAMESFETLRRELTANAEGSE